MRRLAPVLLVSALALTACGSGSSKSGATPSSAESSSYLASPTAKSEPLSKEEACALLTDGGEESLGYQVYDLYAATARDGATVDDTWTAAQLHVDLQGIESRSADATMEQLIAELKTPLDAIAGLVDAGDVDGPAESDVLRASLQVGTACFDVNGEDPGWVAYAMPFLENHRESIAALGGTTEGSAEAGTSTAADVCPSAEQAPVIVDAWDAILEGGAPTDSELERFYGLIDNAYSADPARCIGIAELSLLQSHANVLRRSILVPTLLDDAQLEKTAVGGNDWLEAVGETELEFVSP